MIDLSATDRLLTALAGKPRVSLGHFPTPLDEAPRLSARLGVRVLIKRDDQTGLALGGNKVRKLEYLIAHALAGGADCIVTTGGSQSNHARITAAACRRVQIDCHLVLDRGVHAEYQGNMLLDTLLGAHVQLVDSPDPAVATRHMEAVAEDLKARGRKPFIIPRGGSIPPGAAGYVAFIPELVEQLARLQLSTTSLYLGTGSTGTHSGVLAGVIASGASLRVQGISVSRTRAEQVAKIFSLANATLHYLGLPSGVTETDVRVDEAYRGPAYGIPTPGTMEAIEIAARDEGLILDPVYTGKAMAGLIGHARGGHFAPNETVVFLHTGGAPALFAYHSEVFEAIQAGRR